MGGVGRKGGVVSSQGRKDRTHPLGERNSANGEFGKEPRPVSTHERRKEETTRRAGEYGFDVSICA